MYIPVALLTDHPPIVPPVLAVIVVAVILPVILDSAAVICPDADILLNLCNSFTADPSQK